MDSLTDDDLQTITGLRNRGFAVVVFTPSELGDTNPKRVEDVMVERGFYAIKDLA